MFQVFNAQKMKALLGMFGAKVHSEDDTISGFFDESVGYTFEVTYDQGTAWTLAGMPEIVGPRGSVLHGVLAHVNAANLTPNSFSIVYERVDGATYEPLTGDLDVMLTRRGLAN